KGTKQQRKEKLGDAAKLNAAQARELAREKLSKVTLGGDPQGDKKKERQSEATTLTFAKAVDQYLAMKEREVMNGDYRSSSLKNTTLYLRGYYFASLHKRALNDMQRADIASCLNKIGTDSGEVSRGRARAAVSALYVWAMQEGLCEQNPTIGTRPQAERVEGDRVLDDDELKAVW